ncbi:MAG: AAA family ATPase [Thermoleophilia bacterium]
MLVGRDAERSRIGALLDDARASRSGTLVLRGEAGVGKTALLEDARERATDMHVLTVRGIESEVELPFAGLHQLVRPALDLVDRLPGPQAAALLGALGMAERGGDDRFLISAACLTLLSELSERRPVLCLVDDAQWLDTPSSDALEFVARRLGGEGIAVLISAREGDERHFDGRGLPSVTVEGLAPDDAAALVEERAGTTLAPFVRALIVEQAGGNALALSEMPAVLSRAQLAGEEPLPDTLPLPGAIERTYLDRVQALPDDVQVLLLAAAADDSRRVSLVMEAAEALGAGPEALDLAERSGLVVISGLRIDFRHPLVRSAVYQGAPSGRRRAAHKALADALAEDGNRRVWHLAAAALGPDEDVAAALERAADDALDRTGFAAGASALERAAALTPDQDARLRRQLRAAEAFWRSGHGEHARRLLAGAVQEAQDPVLRADMLHLLGHIQHLGGPSMPAHDLLRDAAVLVEERDPERATRILSDAFEAALYAGDPAACLDASRRARALAPRDGGVADFLADLDMGEALFISGLWREGVPMFERAAEIFAASPELAADPYLTTRGVIGICWLERCAEARPLVQGAVAAARARGAVAMLPYTLFMAAWAARRTGDWEDAITTATEGVVLARDLGQETMVFENLFELVVIAAARGDEETFRAGVAEGLDIAERVGSHYLREAVLAQSGVLELTLGRLDLAVAEAEASAVRLRAMGIRVNELVPVPDLIEALARLGRMDEARAAVPRLAEHEAHPRTGAAILARCEGIVAEDAAEADAHFVRALALHPEDEDVFGRARTRLLRGERLRRSRRRVEAREELRAALAAFERLGATPWADRARSELRASGETAVRRDPVASAALTPQELQVARYVQQGFTNKEVAAQLFLSPRTIDAHLRNVFGKLGITARSQLRGMPLGAPGEAPVPEPSP